MQMVGLLLLFLFLTHYQKELLRCKKIHFLTFINEKAECAEKNKTNTAIKKKWWSTKNMTTHTTPLLPATCR